MFGVVAGMSWWKVRLGMPRSLWHGLLSSWAQVFGSTCRSCTSCKKQDLVASDKCKYKVMIMCPYDIYRSLYSASGWRSSCRPIPPCMGKICVEGVPRVIPESYPSHTRCIPPGFHSCVAVAMRSLWVCGTTSHSKEHLVGEPFSLREWLLDLGDVWQTLETVAGVQA